MVGFEGKKKILILETILAFVIYNSTNNSTSDYDAVYNSNNGYNSNTSKAQKYIRSRRSTAVRCYC